MVKKVCIGAAIVVGLVYGSGGTFTSIMHRVESAADANAHNTLAREAGGWGR